MWRGIMLNDTDNQWMIEDRRRLKKEAYYRVYEAWPSGINNKRRVIRKMTRLLS